MLQPQKLSVIPFEQSLQYKNKTLLILELEIIWTEDGVSDTGLAINVTRYLMTTVSGTLIIEEHHSMDIVANKTIYECEKKSDIYYIVLGCIFALIFAALAGLGIRKLVM